MDELQHAKILNALTKYDEKQSRKKFYNHYALAQYCKALQNTQTYCDDGAELRLALVNAFCGRLLDIVLNSVGLEKSTDDEQRGIHTKLEIIDEES